MNDNDIAKLVSASPIALEDLESEAQEFIGHSVASHTRRARASDWLQFTEWCATHGRIPLPAQADTIALYLAHLARSKKATTISRHIATLSVAHHRAGYLAERNPTRHAVVREVWQGIQRELGMASRGKKAALIELIRSMIQNLPPTLIGVRDRALILVGFAGAMRRSELVALTMDNMERTPEGIVLTIARSKTDQKGYSRKVGIPFGKNKETCPVRNLEEWLQRGNIDEGPIFRGVNRHGKIGAERLTDQTVARVVKKALSLSGINSKEYAGHSLRAGLATQAARGGASERSIQKQTGHQSVIVLRRYIRDGELFRDNAVDDTGL
jgi:site-specific recombinase XerD